MDSLLSPLNVTVGTYDGTIAGLSLECDDPKDYTSALTLTTNFATSTHASAVRSIALHGSLLATGGADETIHLYDVRSRIELGTFLHHDSTITSLNFTNDNGRILLFSSGGKGDSAICIWHKESKSDWALLRRLEGHAPDTSGIRDIAVHPSTAVCLSIADDRALFMWNLKKGKIAFSVKTKRLVKRVNWSPLGNKYVLAGENGIITVSDLSGNDISTWLSGESTGDVECATFIDESVVACGSDDGIVRLWDSRKVSDSNPDIMMKHDARLTGLQYVEGLVVGVDAGGGLKVWDVRMSGEPRIETDMATKAGITCMAAAQQVWQPPIIENEDDCDDENDVEYVQKKNKKREQEEMKASLEGTASQRKRKKRKQQESRT